jgi:hypothetical protein
MDVKTKPLLRFHFGIGGALCRTKALCRQRSRHLSFEALEDRKLLTAAEWMMPAGGDGEYGDVKLFIPDNLLVGRGGLITVPVKLEITGNEAVTISGFEVVIEFDSTKLTVVGSELGQLLADPNSDVEPTWTNPADGILIQLGDSMDGSIPFDVGTVGELFAVTFAVASDAPSGPSPINIRAAYKQTTTAMVSNDLIELVIWPTPTDAADDPNDGVVTIVENPRIDITIVDELTATIGNGEVATLPASAVWVHEWQSFWVEIWVSTPETTTLGVAGATVDLQYYADYLTAMEIVHGPAFNVDPSGTIDDAQGLVSGIGGRTELSDVGDDAYVLLARVRFISTGDDQVPVDAAGRNIGPYDMELGLASGQTELVDVGPVVPELGGPPATELWAVMYDVEDNNQIDFGDFSFFAAAFGRMVGDPADEPPYVWWADFDRSGRVDFGDLAFFAPNFGKSRAAVQSGAQMLVFPTNFPDAWRGGSSTGQGESQLAGGEREALDGDRLLAGFDGAHQARTQPWQWAWAVDEAHAALHAEAPPSFSRGTTAGPEAWPALLLRHESPGTLYSRSDRPVATSGERPEWQFEDGEEMEDLLPSLAEPRAGRSMDDLLDPHDVLFTQIGR